MHIESCQPQNISGIVKKLIESILRIYEYRILVSQNLWRKELFFTSVLCLYFFFFTLHH
jgi:hypothetical protein